jgi:hypothetical protein
MKIIASKGSILGGIQHISRSMVQRATATPSRFI